MTLTAGNLDKFKVDLKQDLDSLDNLYVNLQKFAKKVEKEVMTATGKGLKPFVCDGDRHKSCDDKLESLSGQQFSLWKINRYLEGEEVLSLRA